MFDYDENLITVTEYNVLGKLPDPFLKDNGERIQSQGEWLERRKEIYRYAVELQYGTIAPAPEFFKLECTYRSDNTDSYRITAGTKEKQAVFMLKIFKPKDADGHPVKNPPVVVDGDLCFNYAFNSDYLNIFLNNGIAYATFNRTELANDIQHEGRRQGPLYDVYPEYGFGALGAWAWGYSRAVDALERIGEYNLDCLAFTGHSRGGKTAMLAGVLDERCKIVNPNETNAGSCSCYRIHMKAIGEDNQERPGERLCDLHHNFDFWLGEEMGKYTQAENELPFDCHFLKAMVAPRILMVGEAASDMWTNPVGSWQTSMAATEVYKFLGCEKNFYWYFRKGFHFHHPADAEMLMLMIKHVENGSELPLDRFYRTPFQKPEKIWDWDRPGC